MQRNKARALLRELRNEAIEKAHAAMIVSLAGYGVSLLVLLVLALRAVPTVLVCPILGMALLLPAACTLWAMWRVQNAIKYAFGNATIAYGVYGRIIEFQVPAWRIIGSE